MKLAQMIKLALSQLDEDIEDVADHEELLKMYVNQGYHIAMERHYKPKVRVEVRSNEYGWIKREDIGRGKIAEICDYAGRHVPYHMTLDGAKIMVPRTDTNYVVYSAEEFKPLVSGEDEPRFPEYAHSGLVDYACYKFLVNGNAAKQQRAGAYHQEFLRAMQRIEPQGQGSVTHMHGLYAATDIKSRRC